MNGALGWAAYTAGDGISRFRFQGFAASSCSSRATLASSSDTSAASDRGPESGLAATRIASCDADATAPGACGRVGVVL